MNRSPGTTTSTSGPLVVKLGGAAVDDPAGVPWLWDALVRLAASRCAHRSGVVIVHGGGKAVDRLLDRLGCVTERRDGIRLTPPDQIDPIVGVLAGTVNKTIVGCLHRHGGRAVGICLGDGDLCATRTSIRHGFDAGRVGEVVGGDPSLAMALLANGLTPVVSSIGLDDSGLPLNVNADEAAAGLAAVLNASGLLLLTDVAGVLDRDGATIGHLDAPSISRLIADGTITGGMIPKVHGALEAARLCGAPVTIAAWNRADELEALIRGDVLGTTVLPSPTAMMADGVDVAAIALEEPELPALAGWLHGGETTCRP